MTARSRSDPRPASKRARRVGKRQLAESRYINRELSWLDFETRVLALAEDAGSPLLERAKFLAIVSSNLDEFFQVRVAGLMEQVSAGVTTRPPDGMTAAEQLRAIRQRVEVLTGRIMTVFNKEVLPGLKTARVRVVGMSDLRRPDKKWLQELFEEQIFPVLTPLAVDPAHPFPYISNLSLNLAVLVRDKGPKTTRFARVKVPPVLPRFVAMPDGRRFIPLEQVIAANLDSLFPGMKVLEHHPFRVTRNADLDVEEDEADDLLDAIEAELRNHRNSADVVRLEVAPGMSDEILRLLVRELELSPADVYRVDGLLDPTCLWQLYDLNRPDLKDKAWVGTTQPRLSEGPTGRPDFFRVLKERDVFVHHPYDSFATSVEAFIDQAARDPRVLAIKQTLYRTSGPEGGIIRSLIRAAETGKQVVALVELKARFDEQANIVWARALEQAGVHVVYGLVGLKTHAKASLIVRREDGKIRRFCHLATGNYNPKTATIYEDVGIFTSDAQIGEDVTELFNYLTGYSHQHTWRRLLVAPLGLRESILKLIRREAAAPDGNIVMKMNSLVDERVVEALYKASTAGTRIELITRGICCLRPGVPGLSDNIRVRSIVGRFLEHSRIYRFGSESRGQDYFIGSADMMPRNLDRRIEVMVPVLDADIQARVEEIIDSNLNDDVLAWQLGPDGAWSRVPSGRGVNAHLLMQDLATERSHPGVPASRA